MAVEPDKHRVIRELGRASSTRVDHLESHKSVGNRRETKRSPGRDEQRIKRVFPFLVRHSD